jgi:hypothetical protein
MNARTVGVGAGLGLVVMLSPDASLPGWGPPVTEAIARELPVLARACASAAAGAAPLGDALLAAWVHAQVALPALADPRVEWALATLAVLGLALGARALAPKPGSARRVRSLARRGLGTAAIARRTGLAQDLVRDWTQASPESSARKGLPVGNLLRTGRGRTPHAGIA